MLFRFNIVTLLVLVIFTSCKRSATITNATVVIHGQSQNIDGALVKLTNLEFDKVFATDTIKAGKFSLHTTVPSEGIYQVDFSGKYKHGIYTGWGPNGVKIYLADKETYKILAGTDQDILYNRVKVESNLADQQKLQEYQEQLTFRWEEVKKELKAIDSLRDIALNKEDFRTYDALSAEIIQKENYLAYNLTSDFIKEFSLKNTNSIITSWVLLKVNDLQVNFKLYSDIYKRLDPQVKAHEYSKKFKKRLDAVEKLEDGMKFPQLLGRQINGQTFTYNFADSKYTLVDLWASWCIPCRNQHPMLNTLYQTFNKKGFNIISVSFDESMEQWNEAILKDQLLWKNHVSDLKGMQNSINAMQLDITSIPQNYLIDSEGNILQRNISLDNLQVYLKKKL